ncbi:MAG: hypothetical protein VKL39_15330 [Leptolyngbyaceae bacterium]|nr:hypothetical protein [Leptolyngbyaceae bacterium]
MGRQGGWGGDLAGSQGWSGMVLWRSLQSVQSLLPSPTQANKSLAIDLFQ